MPVKPESIIGEILGKPAKQGANPASLSYVCPYIGTTCTKRSTALGDEPYPVCTIWRTKRKVRQLVFVCPNRFHQVDFLNDVVEHCWVGNAPKNLKVAHEVQMTGFGNVDFVVADVDANGKIVDFLSVELQAIDISGSVMPAYSALLAGESLEKRPSHGFNWANVYKRYITQLIAKGFYHHHWNSKIVAVIQKGFFDYIIDRADFMRSTNVQDPNANIIFLVYSLEPDPNAPGQFCPTIVNVEGTSHSSLQAAILYKTPPSRDAFCERIKHSLGR